MVIVAVGQLVDLVAGFSKSNVFSKGKAMNANTSSLQLAIPALKLIVDSVEKRENTIFSCAFNGFEEELFVCVCDQCLLNEPHERILERQRNDS